MNKIGIIGTGNMGEAIIKALLQTGLEKERILFTEVKTDRADFVTNKHGVRSVPHAEELIKKVHFIILAVKPQDSKKVMHEISPFLEEGKIVISIMAGVTTSNILSAFSKSLKVIRLMPNICVKVGEGAIGITSNDMVKAEEMEEVKKLLSPLGKIVEVGEEHMDAMTALVGSGPAFFLQFLESMIDAGVKMGIARDKARAISTQVVKGTVRMLEEEDLHPTLMKEMITSPGGTTIAGLTLLEDEGFKGKVIRAIEEARRRSKELSS